MTIDGIKAGGAAGEALGRTVGQTIGGAVELPVAMPVLLFNSVVDNTKKALGDAKSIGTALSDPRKADLVAAGENSGKLLYHTSGVGLIADFGSKVKNYFGDFVARTKGTDTKVAEATPAAATPAAATPAKKPIPLAFKNATMPPEATPATTAAAPKAEKTAAKHKKPAADQDGYTIKPGDTLFNIVKGKTGLTDKKEISAMVEQVRKDNNLADADKIITGHKLKFGENVAKAKQTKPTEDVAATSAPKDIKKDPRMAGDFLDQPIG